MDANYFENGKKKLRFQTKTDTGGRGLKIRHVCSQNLTENDTKITQNNFCSKVLIKTKLQNLQTAKKWPFRSVQKRLKITQRQFSLHKYMNSSSEFYSTKANSHLFCRLDSSSSFCNSFSSSLEGWQLASWLGFFQPFCRYRPLKKFAVEMKASRLCLNFAANQRENRANSFNCFKWFPVLALLLCLIGRWQGA